jgi:opacity protein-like surface antigen
MGPIYKMFALVGASALASTAALAADLAAPQPQYVQPAPEVGGWYLRGDVGVGAQNFKSYDFTQTNAASGALWPASWQINQKDIKDAAFIGLGLGYQWNSWLRFDVTGEYRADVKFKAVGSYAGAADFCGGGTCFDVYDGDHQASVFLANAYFDLGTWWCVTPFIGAGVGGVYHRTSSLTDSSFIAGGSSALGITTVDHSNWDFAWAVHAGLSYQVSSNFKVELAYRFLSMGSAQTSEVLCGANGCGAPGGGPRAFYTLTDMTSQDIKLGVRWMLQPEPAPAPLMRRG